MMRGYDLRIEQQRTQDAVLALMIRRAMNEKRISLDDLLGRKPTDDRKQRQNRVVSIDEKRRTLEELERALGVTKGGER
jgi:hypothetical protein